eukprot:778518-Amphidinium_carterae.2
MASTDQAFHTEVSTLSAVLRQHPSATRVTVVPNQRHQRSPEEQNAGGDWSLEWHLAPEHLSMARIALNKLENSKRSSKYEGNWQFMLEVVRITFAHLLDR